MPIKKDGTGNRWVEMEFIAPGTPEQVWQAMATGPGCAAWFTKAEIEERVGGELRFDFGPDGSSKGEVTVWDPPHHFGYIERDWNVGAPPVATEITITNRSAGRSVVRMVHSLFSSTDDWDDQMEGFESGWPGFFEVLRVYLTHFAGQRAACFMALTSIDGAPSDAWTTLTSALGLAGANVGERRSSPGEPEMLAGTIERVHQDGHAALLPGAPRGSDLRRRAPRHLRYGCPCQRQRESLPATETTPNVSRRRASQDGGPG